MVVTGKKYLSAVIGDRRDAPKPPSVNASNTPCREIMMEKTPQNSHSLNFLFSAASTISMAAGIEINCACRGPWYPDRICKGTHRVNNECQKSEE